MIVVDDFLPPYVFEKVQNYFLSESISWKYCDGITSIDSDSEEQYQFVHYVYDGLEGVLDNDSTIMTKLLVNRFCPPVQTLARIKVNMMMKTQQHYLPGMHVDYGNNLGMKTAIYYLNTTNGKTVFETGEEVDCIENRVVIFDANTFHSGYTCTDSKRRVVINFDYYPRQSYDESEKWSPYPGERI